MLPQTFIDEYLTFIRAEKPKKALMSKKLALSKKYGLKYTPSDIEILTHLNPEEYSEIKKHLITKPTRTGSGVTVVAVMTKPMRCPHGKCTYCPGGPGSVFGDVPQSYTGHEPATMRGIRAAYDAYIQVFNRLEQYVVLGQNPEKVELILMGGTFPSYPDEYQDEVIRDIFKAMNDFSRLFYDLNTESQELVFDFEKFKEFFELPGKIGDETRAKKIQEKIMEQKNIDYEKKSIPELQEENENAVIRCVGLTIETRPSHAKREHGLKMLEQGCTRVELGVQTTFDDVLTKVHRDHSVQDSIDAIRDLRNLGFKLNFHIMLGLPLMTPKRDLESLRRIFSDSDFQPDMIKIYPCMVMEGTPLYYDYKKGDYTPYSTEQAAELIAEATPLIPEYVRVMRVQRDIPTHKTEAGVDKTNLRQYVDVKLAEKNIVEKDIRSREIGKQEITDYETQVIEYDAAKGKEFFIQIIETNNKGLIGFARLRFPSEQLHPEITEDSAMIRELHVYGTSLSIGKKNTAGSTATGQHKGFGQQLMEKAEEICREHGKKKLLVISGVGVRQYYKRKLGYKQAGPYVAKVL